jgi:hypothetical protein
VAFANTKVMYPGLPNKLQPRRRFRLNMQYAPFHNVRNSSNDEKTECQDYANKDSYVNKVLGIWISAIPD